MANLPIILIANDDGIHATGLKALEATIKNIFEDKARVITVAPEVERSGASHAISLRQPLRVKECGKDRYAVSGTPADCVLFGIREVASQTPKLVLSGINRGFNLGQDTMYSGTVAAALEATLNGVVSLAISQAWRKEDSIEDYSASCRVVKKIFEEFQLDSFVDSANDDRLVRFFGDSSQANWKPMMNINVPNVADFSEIRGFKVASLGLRNYDARFVRKEDPRKQDYFWLGGSGRLESAKDQSDCSFISERYVTLSALRPQLSCPEATSKLTEVTKDMKIFR